MAIQYLWCQADNVLPLVVLHQVQMLQCGYYVLLAYARLFTYLTVEMNNCPLMSGILTLYASQ